MTLDGRSEATREYEVIVRSKLEPHQVLLNRVPLNNRAHPAPELHATQWWWDPSNGETHVVFQGGNFSVEIQGVSAAQYTD